jgi:hypothetical protein
LFYFLEFGESRGHEIERQNYISDLWSSTWKDEVFSPPKRSSSPTTSSWRSPRRPLSPSRRRPSPSRRRTSPPRRRTSPSRRSQPRPESTCDWFLTAAINEVDGTLHLDQNWTSTMVQSSWSVSVLIISFYGPSGNLCLVSRI